MIASILPSTSMRRWIKPDEPRIKTLLKLEDQTLKASKYIWLKGPERFTDKQQRAPRFDDLRDQDLDTARVWSFKETFRAFFACETAEGGHLFFNQWYEDAIALGNTHLTKSR